MKSSQNQKATTIGVIALVLLLCVLASLVILFGRMSPFSQKKYENILPLLSGSDSGATGLGSSGTTSTGSTQSPAESEGSDSSLPGSPGWAAWFGF